ncbi:MAG: 6-pyruvoyl-tetrahydropterin synthase-related protein [Anaerolineales bacterium]
MSGLTALLALTLLAVWPILQSGAPDVDDGPNHYYRLAALARHVEHGDILPRWISDLHYGYGSPLFQFYAPLSYYVPLGINRLGASLPDAFQAGFALATVIAVGGMYFWGRAHFNSRLSGLAAAGGYALAPYPYINVFYRAAWPEYLALALVPWVFGLAARVVRRSSRGAYALLAFSYAALILSHNLTAALFTPLLLVYIGALAIAAARVAGRSVREYLWRPALALGHALALAAFFLLPFFVYVTDVQLDRAEINYSDHFLAPSALFSLPRPFDPLLASNDQPKSLGWPQLMLAAAALGGFAYRFARRIPRRGDVLLMAVNGALLGAAIFLMLEVSAPVWDALPFGGLVQFPWRLLGPASFLVAGLAVAGLPPGRSKLPVAALYLAACFFFALTWTYHESFSAYPATPRPLDILRYEQSATNAYGTTSRGALLPRWVGAPPGPDDMMARFAASDIPSRVTTIPPGLDLKETQLSLTTTALDYNSPTPVQVQFNRFYFPGWTATVDAEPAPIAPSEPEGLITVKLPAGQYTALLELRATPAQRVGALVSALALIAAIGAAIVACIGGKPPHMSIGLGADRTGWLAVLFGGLILLRIGVLDRIETPFYRSRLQEVSHPLAVNYDDQLSLVGYETPMGMTFAADEMIPIDLFWQTQMQLDADYSVTVQLTDSFGARFGQSDIQHPGGIPTSRWSPSQYARDEHSIAPLPGTPPGQYFLMVGVYAAADDSIRPLEIRTGDQPSGFQYAIGPFLLNPARSQVPGTLGLWEAHLATTAIDVGEILVFDAVWHTGQASVPGLGARLSLTNESGAQIWETDFAPGGPGYPAEEWTPEMLVRYPQAITLPPDLPPGRATVSLALAAAGDELVSQPVEIGQIDVRVPMRTYDIPPMDRRVNFDFRDGVRLLGYDVTAGSITLYWTALRPLSDRLTVFVHSLGPDGALVAAQDSPPRRATTSWLPGEVITDVHELKVGARFQIGLYDPQTGERFGEPRVFTGQ